jgi:hypothetical protein
MNVATRHTEPHPDTAVSRLEMALDEGERITHLVPAIGCVVALTPLRLLVVREGSAFRPKTGVRGWALEDGLSVRAGLVRHGTGSLVIKWDRSATSVFVRAEEWDKALALVGAARARVRIEEAVLRAARRRPQEDQPAETG